MSAEPLDVVRLGVTTSAIGMAILGAALIFAPAEIGTLFVSTPQVVLLQLLGAALFGFAVMNWTARGSALGGIYGRAVVAGNQAHFLIGALLLLSSRAGYGAHAAYWALAAFYIAGAAFFTYLLFFSSGLRR